jgi:hypothetical protein
MGLGLAGGALALSAALVGEGYEKLFGNSNKLDAHSLAICFESGGMMFAKRSDIICHEIQVKEGLLSPTTYRVVVAGIFSHVRRNRIDLAFYFDGNDLLMRSWLSGVRNVFTIDLHRIGSRVEISMGCYVER